MLRQHGSCSSTDMAKNSKDGLRRCVILRARPDARPRRDKSRLPRRMPQKMPYAYVYSPTVCEYQKTFCKTFGTSCRLRLYKYYQAYFRTHSRYLHAPWSGLLVTLSQTQNLKNLLKMEKGGYLQSWQKPRKRRRGASIPFLGTRWS